MAALTFVVGDAVPGIEFETAGNQHGRIARQGGRGLYNLWAMLFFGAKNVAVCAIIQ